MAFSVGVPDGKYRQSRRIFERDEKVPDVQQIISVQKSGSIVHLEMKIMTCEIINDNDSRRHIDSISNKVTS